MAQNGRGHVWTDTDTLILREAWSEGASVDNIRIRIPTSRRTIYSKVKKLGLPKRKRRGRIINFIPRLPKNANPLAKVLFSMMRKHKVSIPMVAERAGVAAETIRSWGNHHTPSIENLDACLMVVGHRLVVRQDTQVVIPRELILFDAIEGPRQ